jgi:DDE superfamily endonuclease
MMPYAKVKTALGLPLPRRRPITGYGVKPLQVVEPLYESSWLDAAVEPTTGAACWWALPRLDADCFTLFLAKCGRYSAESRHRVLLDQAPAPGAPRVQWPANVVLVWLPAYSPAWNPVERLWEDLKARLDVQKAQVRSSLRGLREHVADMGRSSTTEVIASLTGSSSPLEAVCAL